MKAFGFNTTLAPVLDLALPESARVMGTRAAAAKAGGVVDYARAFWPGWRRRELWAAASIFPDSAAARSTRIWRRPRFAAACASSGKKISLPIASCAIELPMVMVNHAAYPNTPGKDRPASVSPYWITTVLRKRIGYRGIIFSDDLEMGGILKFMSIEEAAVAAIRAGMDLLEICHSPEMILRAYEALIAEAERSLPFANLLLSRAEQMARRRKTLCPRRSGGADSQAIRGAARADSALQRDDPKGNQTEAQPA